MKATGIVRRVDDLGRIVLPKELRDTMDIAEKDPLEIYVEGEKVILKPYRPGCIFCGDVEDLTEVNGKKACGSCVDNLLNKSRKTKSE